MGYLSYAACHSMIGYFIPSECVSVRGVKEKEKEKQDEEEEEEEKDLDLGLGFVLQAHAALAAVGAVGVAAATFRPTLRRFSRA